MTTIPSIDPYVNGLIFEALKSSPPGSIIDLPVGMFSLQNMVDPLVPLSGIKFRGQGPDKTILYQNTFPSKGELCGFELANGLCYENLTLKSPQAPGLQNITVGWSKDETYNYPDPQNQTARLIGCHIYGHVHGIYCWAGYRNRLIVDSCRVFSGRWAVSNGDSSAFDSCLYSLYDTHILCDWKRFGPGAGNSKSNSIVGLCLQGGRCEMTRGSITVDVSGIPKGTVESPTPELDLAVGAWTSDADHPGMVYGNGEWPYIRLNYVPINMIGTNAKQILPTLQTIGKLELVR